MRADGVLRLILNVSIFPDMKAIITGDKYVRFVGVEEGQPMSFLLKVSWIFLLEFPPCSWKKKNKEISNTTFLLFMFNRSRISQKQRTLFAALPVRLKDSSMAEVRELY